MRLVLIKRSLLILVCDWGQVSRDQNVSSIMSPRQHDHIVIVCPIKSDRPLLFGLIFTRDKIHGI
jgi:hypothetical protein